MVCINISDKDFQGQVIRVEMAARKVPPGGFVRGRGKPIFELKDVLQLNPYEYLQKCQHQHIIVTFCIIIVLLVMWPCELEAALCICLSRPAL